MRNFGDWAFLSCRVMALYALHMTILHLEAALYALSRLGDKNVETTTTIYAVAYVVIALIEALVLWFGAPWISKKMAQNGPVTVEGADWNTDQLMSVFVAALGLFFVIDTLPFFAINFVDSFNEYTVVSTPRLVKLGTEFAIGVALLFGSNVISTAINKARSWG